MHTLRKLAREIHRRSVWQVMGVYALLCWGIVQGLGILSVPLGLPLWTEAMAIVLLLIGLPIVLATTVTQGGLPWLRIEDVEDPNDLPGRTPEEVHVIPNAHPLYGAGVFTWRHAILGGMMAAALLVTSVVAYLVMWGLGIGPVGSLLAQGILDPGERVLFVQAAQLPAPAAEALHDHLSRSTVVSIEETPPSVGAGIVEAGLAYANQQGIRVVIVGDLVQEGTLVMLSGRVLSARGEQLAAFDEVARSEVDMVRAAQLVSIRLRERIGESLRTIRSE